MEQSLLVTAERMPVRPASGAEEPAAKAPQEYLEVEEASPLFSRKSGEDRSISWDAVIYEIKTYLNWMSKEIIWFMKFVLPTYFSLAFV